MTEVWMPVPGYGDHYEASSLGNIRSKERVVLKNAFGALRRQHYKSKILQPSTAKHGHKYVHLGVGHQKFTVAVHKLVLLAFVGPCPDGMECCHGNGDAGDNRPCNLRWDTHASNNAERKKHGRYAAGEKHHMATISDEQARAIKYYGIHHSEVGISYRHAWRIRNGEIWKSI